MVMLCLDKGKRLAAMSRLCAISPLVRMVCMHNGSLAVLTKCFAPLCCSGLYPAVSSLPVFNLLGHLSELHRPRCKQRLIILIPKIVTRNERVHVRQAVKLVPGPGVSCVSVCHD